MELCCNENQMQKKILLYHDYDGIESASALPNIAKKKQSVRDLSYNKCRKAPQWAGHHIASDFQLLSGNAFRPSRNREHQKSELPTAPWIRDVRRGARESLFNSSGAHFFFFPPLSDSWEDGRLRFLSPPVRRSHEAFEVRSESALGRRLKFKFDWSKNPQPLPVVVEGRWN